MKKFFRILCTAATVLAFSGCLSLTDGLNQSMGDAFSSAAGLDDVAAEMQALQFYSVFAIYAVYGGYSFDDTFEEGDGVRWLHSSPETDESGEPVTVERAYLKDMGDGTGWWRMAVEGGEDSETIEYEYLMDSEYEILVIRYRDPETGEIREYIPPEEEEGEISEEEASAASGEDSMEDEDVETLSDADYAQYNKGPEKVTTPAGTFTADHLMYEVKDRSDPDNPVDFQYDWWRTDEVPGGMVRYLWTDHVEEREMNSELIEILSGQSTRMRSY